MALELSLDSPLQSNDQTTLRLTDNTGIYNVATNPSGWGTPNTDLADIDGSTTALTITITITTSDGTETAYDAIDAYTYLGAAPTSVNDLVFDITSDLLISGGDALGTSEDKLPDGWYVIEYSVDHGLAGGSGSTNTYTTIQLFDGQVRAVIYDDLRQISPLASQKTYETFEYESWREWFKPVYYYSLLQALIADLSTATKTETLNLLATLEILVL
jgi:hypothetical protein